MMHGTAAISTPPKRLPTRRQPAPRQATPAEHSARSATLLLIGEQRFLRPDITTQLPTAYLSALYVMLFTTAFGRMVRLMLTV